MINVDAASNRHAIDPRIYGVGSNGKSADDFIAPTFAAGVQPMMIVPVMGLLPKDRVQRCGFSIAKYGAQDASDGYMPDCGNGKKSNARA